MSPKKMAAKSVDFSSRLIELMASGDSAKVHIKDAHNIFKDIVEQLARDQDDSRGSLQETSIAQRKLKIFWDIMFNDYYYRHRENFISYIVFIQDGVSKSSTKPQQSRDYNEARDTIRKFLSYSKKILNDKINKNPNKREFIRALNQTGIGRLNPSPKQASKKNRSQQFKVFARDSVAEKANEIFKELDAHLKDELDPHRDWAPYLDQYLIDNIFNPYNPRAVGVSSDSVIAAWDVKLKKQPALEVRVALRDKMRAKAFQPKLKTLFRSIQRPNIAQSLMHYLLFENSLGIGVKGEDEVGRFKNAFDRIYERLRAEKIGGCFFHNRYDNKKYLALKSTEYLDAINDIIIHAIKNPGSLTFQTLSEMIVMDNKPWLQQSQVSGDEVTAAVARPVPQGPAAQ